MGDWGERNEVVMQAEEIELGDNQLQGLEAEINLRWEFYVSSMPSLIFSSTVVGKDSMKNWTLCRMIVRVAVHAIECFQWFVIEFKLREIIKN